MKNLFLTLLTGAIFFTSCSSDDDIINSGTETSTQKYAVTFNVKTTDFTVETTPLRSLTDKGTFLQIVAYKESGEVYSDTVIVPEQIKDVITTDGNFPFKLELPNGKYHLAFIQKSYYTLSVYGKTPETFKLKPSNFFTDKYGGGPLGYIIPTSNDANVSDYYQTIDITIAGSSQEIVSNIILEPMWSTVYISIDNLTPPSGCNFITIDLKPAYSIYDLSDKLAKIDLSTHYNGVYKNGGLKEVKPSVNNGTITQSLNVSKTTVENNNMKLIIYYYKNYTRELILTKEVDLKTQVENGLHYNIIGDFSNINNFGGGQMNLTYAPFNENEKIDIPF